MNNINFLLKKINADLEQLYNHVKNVPTFRNLASYQAMTQDRLDSQDEKIQRLEAEVTSLKRQLALRKN